MRIFRTFLITLLLSSILFTSCTEDAKVSEPELLIAVCYNTLTEYSYYRSRLSGSYKDYTTPASVFYDLEDTLKGNYYSYYTEVGGNDGWPWNLFADETTTKSFGMILNSNNDTLIIQKVFESSAAESAGLLEGDKIIGIDSFALFGNIAVFDATTEFNHSYTFHFIRGVAEDSLSLSKSLFTFPLAYSDSLTPDVGYIYLSTFYDTLAGDAFIESLDSTKQFDATIIDMRGNGGGYLSVLDQISEEFLEPNDTIVLTKNYSGQSSFVPYLAAGYWENDSTLIPPKASTIGSRKFVILMDGGSASASEMLAAGLTHNLLSPIVGSKSYGKAIAQSGFNLTSYNGGYGQSTVFKMWMVDETNYANVGITPDSLINSSQESYEDVQLAKAIEAAYDELGIAMPLAMESRAVSGTKAISTNRQSINKLLPKTPVGVPELPSLELIR